MTPLATRAQQLTLTALYYSGACRLLAPLTSGIGMIFMLHHVVRDAPGDFAPNRGLEIDAGFLDAVLKEVRRRGIDIITIDEAARRLSERDFSRRFATFTADDGYIDNFETALPVFQKHAVPLTLYLTTGLPDGDAVLWWRVLEAALAGNDAVRFSGRTLASATSDEKNRAYDELYPAFRNAHPRAQHDMALTLARDNGIDPAAQCRHSALSWDQLEQMLATGLVTIGAHTVSHHTLSRLSPDAARAEIVSGCDRIAERLKVTPTHLAYPYGDAASAAGREFELARELGFQTAVTTRKGVLFSAHADHMHALPRLSLNGFFQRSHYLSALMSGAPFALKNGFRRLDVA